MARFNTRAFWLLALNTLFIGAMVGLERTVLPLLAKDDFELAAGFSLSFFVISFSLSKALFNLLAGFAADVLGRKRVLILGWVLALPIPFLLILSSEWLWVILANILLGISQALTWSMTVNMMVDLMPASRRGFAAGINEFSGYLGVSLLAFLTGLVAAEFGLRPVPFYLGIAAVLLGLGLSSFVAETKPNSKPAPPGWVKGVAVPSLLGLATNFKDGLVWLLIPILLSSRGLSLTEIGLIAGLYPFIWACGQPFFGPLSDSIGRKPLISLGLLLQALGLACLAYFSSLVLAIMAACLLGLGTAMAYPTLIAAVADRAPVEQRASGLGIYRFFRDSGYALGAILAGNALLSFELSLLLAGGVLALLAILAFLQL